MKHPLLALFLLGSLTFAQAADIRFSADHLLEIINRILDMSKIEAGRWKLVLAPVDSAHILSTVRHLAEQRAAKEGVRLETDAASENVELSADAQVLTQIVLNLTINAIKFAGEDRLVRLGCRSLPGERAEFWVVDRGRGMTEAQARRARCIALGIGALLMRLEQLLGSVQLACVQSQIERDEWTPDLRVAAQLLDGVRLGAQLA